MALHISHEQLAQICAHLETGYPNEACGILIGELDWASGHRTVHLVTPVRNAWPLEDGAPTVVAASGNGQRDRYMIDPEDVARADRAASARGLDIIGFFHSHPDSPAIASETDREWAWPVVSFVIARVDAGKTTDVRSWLLRDDRSQFDAEDLHT